MPFNDEERKVIWAALQERGITEVCPACGHKPLFLSDYVSWVPAKEMVTLGDGRRELVTAGALPCITVACIRCGFFMNFHLQALGLWEKFIPPAPPEITSAEHSETTTITYEATNPET